MSASKNSPVTQADLDNFKSEMRIEFDNFKNEIKSIVNGIEHLLNQRTNYLIRIMGALIIGGFSVAPFFIIENRRTSVWNC